MAFSINFLDGHFGLCSRLGVEDLSAFSVSRISSELDGRVEEFLKRPIEHSIPYLFVDASYFKVRTDSRYITKAFLVVTAVRDDGYREILGARIVDGEDELFWTGIFEELKERGLSGVKLVVSDGHKGIQKAVEKSFLSASWQMRHVHFIRANVSNNMAIAAESLVHGHRYAILIGCDP